MKKTAVILSVLALIASSCGQARKNPPDTNIADKTVTFLWRDSNAAIIINEDYCKAISDQEKAALGYVATFIGNECEWDGEYTDDRNNLKCEILTALDLGYQCSGKHLGFLRQWFKSDVKSLEELENCPTTPNTATVQETFDEIILTVKGNEISVFFKATGMNMREAASWSWSETDYFQFDNDHIKLIKKDKSEVELANVNLAGTTWVCAIENEKVYRQLLITFEDETQFYFNEYKAGDPEGHPYGNGAYKVEDGKNILFHNRSGHLMVTMQLRNNTIVDESGDVSRIYVNVDGLGRGDVIVDD